MSNVPSFDPNSNTGNGSGGHGMPAWRHDCARCSTAVYLASQSSYPVYCGRCATAPTYVKCEHCQGEGYVKVT